MLNLVLLVIDAMGKPSSGLLDMNTLWLGSWDECREVEAFDYANYTSREDPRKVFDGKYCRVHLGIALPSFNDKVKFYVVIKTK